ncbi:MULTISPECIES: aminoglycoside adenylyltransferase domain-containing protein [Streptomyces]|nr:MULTISPECIES: aminoglycoside adenylyltransferase domain-containing protein [Streptomyces]
MDQLPKTVGLVRGVLLSLARVWTTLATGGIRSKDG